MKKKVLSVLLTLAMVLTLTTMSVFAAAEALSGELTHESGDSLTWGTGTSCAESVTLNSEGGAVEIKLEGNVNLTGTITVKGTNGAQISSDSTAYTFQSGAITVNEGSKLTIGANVTSVTANITLNKDASLTVDSKTYTARDNSVTLTLTGNTVSGGNITISSGDGAIEATSGSCGTIKANSQDITVSTGTVKVKNDGTVTGSASSSVSIGDVTFADNGTSLSVKAAEPVEITDAKVESLTSGKTVKVGSDTTIGADSTASISVSGGTLTVESGTATVSSGNLTGATVKTGAALKVSDTTYKADGAEATVDLTGSTFTLKTGTVAITGNTTGATVKSNATLKVGTATYKATQDATVNVESSNVTLTGGKVELGSNAAITSTKTGKVTATSGTVTVDASGSVTLAASAKATIDSAAYEEASTSSTAVLNVDSSNVTLTSGSVKLDATGKIKVSGITGEVSGEEVVVDASAKTVKIPQNKTAKLGEVSFAATGDEVTLTVDNANVTVGTLSSASLKVTDSSSAYTVNVTGTNVKFKGEKYQLSNSSDFTVTLEDSETANMEFTGSQEVTVSGGTLKFGGETEISGGKITGVSGAKIKLARSSSDITATSDNNYTIEENGEVKAPATSPTNPGSSSSSTPSTTVDKPVTDAESGETKVDVNTNSTTSGTTAKATVSSSNMDKAVDSAVTEAEKQGTAPVVEVEVKTSARADSLNVTLPAAALEKLAEAEDASLVVTSDIAEVALDNTALSALADQATGSTVTLEVAPVAASELNAAQAAAAGEAAVMDLSLVSNGVVIHDYDGGKITVTLPYKLAEGKDPASVQVYFLDDNGALTPCDTSYADGKVVFTTTHLSKYVIGDESMAPVAFDDVPAGIWYAGAVNYAVKNDLMTGIGGNLFAPDTTTTRAMMVTLLYNLEGKPAVDYAMTYADVPETWFTEAVRWATSEEIVTGYSETAFGPEDTITREQMAVLLCQYAAYKGYDVTAAADLSGYSDAGSVSSWAEGAMRWAVAEGLISGKTADILDPAGDASRAEIAVLLMNFCEKIAK